MREEIIKGLIREENYEELSRYIKNLSKFKNNEGLISMVEKLNQILSKKQLSTLLHHIPEKYNDLRKDLVKNSD